MNDFTKQFDPTASILFLGAGFSRVGTNSIGTPPPTGGELSTILKEKTHLDPDDSSSLSNIAAYAADSGVDLYSLLKDLFTIRSLSSDQEAILEQPWLRIYTTNYDDAVEKYNNEKRLKHVNSFSIGDPVPQQIRPRSVIHLHGYIHKISKEDILKQLILTHKSYAEQAATEDPWYQAFERDLRIAQNIFFVGYELNDFAPARYLTKNPAYREKTHFFLRPAKSPVAETQLKDYGYRYSIGVAGFAEACKNSFVQPKPDNANSLQSFVYFHPVKDGKVNRSPTPMDIQALWAFGTYRPSLVLSTYPSSTYTLCRSSKITDAVEALEDATTLIIHSKVGNGKSMFRHTLCCELATLGYQTFEVKTGVQIAESDIDFIRGIDKAVIVFDGYDLAYANMHLFAGMKEGTKFIVDMLTSTLQVRHTEIFSRLSKPVARLDLNKLSERDVNNLEDLFDKAGILPRNFKNKFSKDSEIRDVVLELFEQPILVDKIDRVIKPYLENAESKIVLFSAAILKSVGINVDPGFIKAISNVDTYEVLSRAGEGALDVVDFSHDRVEPHSAIFSEFIIRKYLTSEEIVSAIFKMTSEAARRQSEGKNAQLVRAREARTILGSLLRFSFLESLLRGRVDSDASIRRLYEQCRRDTNIQLEPLYWLQYSILMQNRGRWDLAEAHMDTAYMRTEGRPGFLTYQLDTNSLGLLLELETTLMVQSTSDRLERIIELLEKSRIMLQEGNHRGHALRSLSKIEPFVRKRRNELSVSYKVRLTYQLILMSNYLGDLSVSDKVVLGSEVIRMQINTAVDLLKDDT